MEVVLIVFLLTVLIFCITPRKRGGVAYKISDQPAPPTPPAAIPPRKDCGCK